MKTKNLLKLPKKTVDAGERKLARFISAPLWLKMMNGTDQQMQQLETVWRGVFEPHIAQPVQVAPPFEEPDSHRRAREIMGLNFLGIEGAQRTFGAYTPEQLAARIEIPFSEETLRACAEEFILLCTHPLDIMGVHAAHPERFTSDPDNPWFSERDQRKAWSSQKISDPWMPTATALCGCPPPGKS